MSKILKVYLNFFIPKLPGGTTHEGSWNRTVSISGDPVTLTKPVYFFNYKMREVAHMVSKAHRAKCC